MKGKTTLYITRAALIAAVYAALCVVLAPISYGAIQVRISEALCILPMFSTSAIPGVTIGCLLANILGGANIFDIVFGTLATLIGAVGTWLLRKKNPVLAVLPPILANTIIIPFVLSYAYGVEDSIPFLMLTIGIGEVLSVGVLGLLLGKAITPIKGKIFE